MIRYFIASGLLALGIAVGASALHDVDAAYAQSDSEIVIAHAAVPPPSATIPPPPIPDPLSDGLAEPPAGTVAPPAAAAPIVEPEDLTVSDVERLWRGGELVAAGMIALFLLLTFLAKADPKRAFYWTSGLTAIGFLVESIARGATPTASMLVIAASTLIALLVRGPLTPPAPARAPERGSANAAMLAVLASIAVGLVLGVVAISSCAAVKREAREVASDLVDCTIDDVRVHHHQYGSAMEEAVRAAINSAGQVDREKLRQISRGLFLRTGGCVLVNTFARLLEPPSENPALPQVSPLVMDPEDARAALAELYPGIRFRTASGVW